MKGEVIKLFNRIWKSLPDALFIAPLSSLCQKYLSRYYKRLFFEQWNRSNKPHWYYHRIDLYRWPNHLNPNWTERGIYSKEVMFPGCKVLDIGCGDGFYARFFYATTASHIDCIDIEQEAIDHARRYHCHPNIRYFKLDAVKEDFPEKEYDVICLDSSIGHLSSEQIDILVHKIREAMGKSGVFTGSEVCETPDNQSWDHQIALASEEELQQLLGKYFSHVFTLYLESPGRQNVYFRCGEDKRRLMPWNGGKSFKSE